ncbi:MAG TPA: ROK family transcriptional regulator [Terracidiphilus sp.]|nr:ROK family transcriptional regulator [Terracidiphilus sp.]
MASGSQDRASGTRPPISARQARGIRHVDLTNVQLASSETARRINRDIVLELIRTSQPISRADLARRSGLQRSTVSQIVEQLMRERWVREGSVAAAPRGRRPTLVGLNEDLVAIAVDIHPKQAIVAIVDLNGRLLSRSLVPLTSDPAASTRLIIECMQRIAHMVPRKSIEGIGISVPGRVDPASQRLTFAPNLHWPDFDLKKIIEAKMDLPVKMENAATACLLAELTFARMDGVSDAVLVTVSEGVGTGVFVNGQLVAGHRGMAGEFGHVPVDPAGPRCACGQKGCWETFASCRAAVRYYRELQPKAAAVTFLELLHLAEEGNASAAQALTKQAQAIGRGLRMIIAGLSPSTILIAGDVTSAWHRYGPAIEKEVAELTLAGPPPLIRPTHESEIARLRGAAALVFQRRPSREGAAQGRREPAPGTAGISVA